MDGQALLWILVVALIACCLIPVILMARSGRRGPLEGPGTGAGGRRGNGRP